MPNSALITQVLACLQAFEERAVGRVSCLATRNGGSEVWLWSNFSLMFATLVSCWQ